MFDFFKYALKMHKTNKQRKKRISFLFKGGYYIFFKDKICRFTFKNMKMIGFFKSLFFVYHISDQGVKKEYLIDANVKTGTMKHAVITDSKCYLVFKEQKQYLRFKKNYSENIGHFNYPIIAPTSYDDDLLYVTEPFAKGRPLTKEEIPQLLRFLLKLFADQPFVTRDDNDIIYYIQHSDPLPGNSLIDDNGNIIFIDLDSITSRPALSDFFNIIFRTQKKEVIFEARKIYEKDLKIAFAKHDTKYNDYIYDLYLSKAVEERLNTYKRGYNNSVLDKSINWIFDDKIKKYFPLTYEMIKKFQFELTPDGYKIIL